MFAIACDVCYNDNRQQLEEAQQEAAQALTKQRAPGERYLQWLFVVRGLTVLL